MPKIDFLDYESRWRYLQPDMVQDGTLGQYLRANNMTFLEFEGRMRQSLQRQREHFHATREQRLREWKPPAHWGMDVPDGWLLYGDSPVCHGNGRSVNTRLTFM